MMPSLPPQLPERYGRGGRHIERVHAMIHGYLHHEVARFNGLLAQAFTFGTEHKGTGSQAMLADLNVYGAEE